MTVGALGAVLLASALLLWPRPLRPARAVLPGLGPAGRSLTALGAGCAVVAAVAAGPWIAAAAGAAAATIAARRARNRRRGASRREGQELAAALEVLVGELRAGAHPVRGFAFAAEESSGLVAGAFQAVAARARLGSDVAAGLRVTAGASSAPQYWSRVALCWQLAVEQGLPMAALMRAAHRDIAGRHRFTDRVEASLSGARATAGLLAGLPLVGILLGQLVGARPIAFLLSGGVWALVAGVCLLCAGITWSDRIIDGVRG